MSNVNLRRWVMVACSADGLRVAALTYSPEGAGLMFISTNGGQSWLQRETARKWSHVALAADGMRIVATVGDGYGGTGHIYSSVDGGATWSSFTNLGIRNWRRAVVSSDGKMIVAAEYYGPLYISRDFGVTWKQWTDAGFRFWKELAASSNCSKFVAIVGTKSGIIISTAV